MKIIILFIMISATVAQGGFVWILDGFSNQVPKPSRAKKVARLLAEAQTCYAERRRDFALKRTEQVLALDPSNIVARKLQEKCQTSREAHIDRNSLFSFDPSSLGPAFAEELRKTHSLKTQGDQQKADTIWKILGISSKKLPPIDIFGTIVDFIEVVDGIPYLTGKGLKPEEKWKIVEGKPEVNAILNAKTPEESVAAISCKGSLLAVGWANKDDLMQSLKANSTMPFEVNVRRLYVDGMFLYTMQISAILRKKDIGEVSTMVIIPKLEIQRYDSTVLKRLSPD